MRFEWQAQYSRSVSMLACRFLVAGTALCVCAFYNFVAGARFCVTWRRWCFDESQWQGFNKHDTVSKVVAGAAFCELLDKWRRLRKNHTF